jgi:hypothetical protein
MSGCTVALDGSLLNASEIEFFNDVDDNVPISHPASLHSLAAAAASSSIASMATTLDNFFSSCSPAAKVAGVCHKVCASHPSARVIGPYNVLMAKAGQRRKANVSGTGRQVTQKCHVDSDTDNGEPDDVEATNSSEEGVSDGGDKGDVNDGAAAQASYNELKAMGGNDRQV